MNRFLNKKIFKIKTQNYIGAVLGVLMFILILQPSLLSGFFSVVSSGINSLADVLSSVLVLETNNFRSTNKESGLAENVLLDKAAQMKAEDMASKGYFSHVAPNGDAPWVWFKKVGYVYSYAGENLAIDFTESSDITTAWINSAKHRANLLNPNFTEIGIGITKGMYQGHETTFVVQFFGKPFTNGVYQATVTKNSAAVQKIASTKASDAIVTRSDLLPGEVLGVQINDNTDLASDEQVKNIFTITIGVLIFLMVVLKIVEIKRDRNYKPKE